MTRQIRIEYENAFYHVMCRGNTRSRIFCESEDKIKFLDYLQKAHEKYKIVIHAYCLMNNHYHLLIQTPSGNLSRAMHSINTGYTNYYNHAHNRTGHLFSGRYKAILVDKDNYALKLSSYIHLNPVKAGLVSKASEYEWSSCRYYLSSGVKPEYLRTDFILDFLKNGKESEIKEYERYLKENLNSDEDLKDQIIAGCVLGKKEFIDWLKERARERKWIKSETPAIKELYDSKELISRIKKEVSKLNEVNDIIKRKLTIYLLRKHTNLTLKEISFMYGDISNYGISKIVRRFKQKILEDRFLKRLVNKVEKRL